VSDQSPSTTIVIFGASGDLTRRKLVPELFRLYPGQRPEAYETLLLNALEGDATLFTRSDGIEAAWRVIDSVLQGWQTDAAPPLTSYAPGSWGPVEADELLAGNGRFWRHGCLDAD
jgi:glucose-6-phosphate 1-dehydrogenase